MACAVLSNDQICRRYNGREYLKVIEDTDMQWQHRKETNRRVRIHGVSSYGTHRYFSVDLCTLMYCSHGHVCDSPCIALVPVCARHVIPWHSSSLR